MIFPVSWRCPFYGIFYYPKHIFIVIHGIFLVTGLKIENVSCTPSEGHAAAEYLASRKPAHKHDFIGIRDIKWLAVHLLTGQLEMLGNALCNGVGGDYRPDTFPVAVTPFQVAGGAAEGFEDLAVVG